MVDEAYRNQDDWIKRSIRTTAKASECLLLAFLRLFLNKSLLYRWASSVRIVLLMNMQKATGTLSPPLFLVSKN
jgi:hypothetical protein